MSEEPRAYFDGKVLNDPVGVAVLREVDRHNCLKTFNLNRDRVEHFIRRAQEIDTPIDELIILILNVDDPLGGPMAEVLMPDHNWQVYRDRGEVPFARGLARRSGILAALPACGHSPTARAIQSVESGELPILVVDHGAAMPFVVMA